MLKENDIYIYIYICIYIHKNLCICDIFMLFFNKKNHETRMLYLKENYFTRKENVVVLIQENILVETTMPDLKHESSYPF